MLRFIAAALAMTALAMAAQSDAPSTATTNTFACCKICTVGKACGNTCISKNDICHIGPGCACDG
jgi:hypothetical protein